jgi:hypothetical protein
MTGRTTTRRGEMSDKRPGRGEVARAWGYSNWESVPESFKPLFEKVAELFGGFALEPVIIPRLTTLRHEDSGIQQFFSFSTEPMDSGGGEGVIYLTQEQVEAACARSNAWEQVKGWATAASEIAEANPEMLDDRIRVYLTGIVNKMTAPEMGVGPDLKS